jgi:hypothetical protein
MASLRAPIPHVLHVNLFRRKEASAARRRR